MKRPIIITLLIAALLLVCTGIGAVVFFGITGGLPVNLSFAGENRVSSILEESETLEVDAEDPVRLNVIDDAGAVTVVGADVDAVQVDVVKTAYAPTQTRADEEVQKIKYKIEQTGNAITITYEVPNSIGRSTTFNTVDFVLTVPTNTTINLDTNFGDVSVTDITGDTDIVNDFGEVQVENVEGALSVSNNSGEIRASAIEAGTQDIELQSDFGAISLTNARGKDITLDSNSGTITLQDVRATGDVHTNTDFGDTSFENGSSASLLIETNSGRVSLIKVRVSEEIKVQDDFGEIELNQALANSYDLHTNSGSITVAGAKGKLKAYTDFGGIKIEGAQGVTLDVETNSGTVTFSGSLGAGPHLVVSDFGEIDLTLPADTKLDVDLSTDFGRIQSDLPITVTLNGDSSSDGDQVVGSLNGGGDEFTAQTNSGSVTIHAGK